MMQQDKELVEKVLSMSQDELDHFITNLKEGPRSYLALIIDKYEKEVGNAN